MKVEIKQIGTEAWGLYIDGRIVATVYAPTKSQARVECIALFTTKITEAP